MKSTRWYDKELDPADNDAGLERAQAIFAELRNLDKQEAIRRRQIAKYIGLYENREIQNLEPGHYPTPGQGLEGSEEGNLTLNVVQSCLDTVAGKIATRTPRPFFVTDGGDYDEKLKAEGLQRFVMGNMLTGKVHQKTERAFYHAGIAGSGFLRPFYNPMTNAIEFDVVFPADIIVDEQAALDMEPRTLFHRRFVAGDILKARYPRYKDIIDLQISKEEKYDTDLVEVVEAFHLRSGPKEKDGVWTVCIKDAVLQNEPWEDEHAFCKLSWTTRIRGYHGQGLVEQLHGIQSEITIILNGIKDNFELHSVPFLLKHIGSKINNAMFNNERGNIIDWEGNIPPELKVFMTTHPEVFNHLWQLYQKAYEIAGISEMSARSVKPAGLESGVALREVQDTETRRFGMLSEAYDEFSLDIARRIVKIARKYPQLTTKWAEGTRYKKIKFKDVSLEEDKYVLRLWPTNLLPETPGGKIATTADLVATGIFTPEQAGGLLAEFPDVKKAMERRQAPRDHIEMLIQHMMTTGEYIPPEIWQPLDLGISIIQNAWLEATVNGVDRERLDGLIRWMEEARDIQEKKMIEMQAKVQAEAMRKAQPKAPAPGAGTPTGGPQLQGV